jgi:hypothetical protein
MQSVADAHDTPSSSLAPAPAGSATGRRAHFLPFQIFASGAFTPSLLTAYPTAAHAIAVGQDTA